MSEQKARLSVDVSDKHGKVVGHLFSRANSMNESMIETLEELNELAARELGFKPFDEDDLEYYYED